MSIFLLVLNFTSCVELRPFGDSGLLLLLNSNPMIDNLEAIVRRLKTSVLYTEMIPSIPAVQTVFFFCFCPQMCVLWEELRPHTHVRPLSYKTRYYFITSRNGEPVSGRCE